jgi:hypothetical protein
MSSLHTELTPDKGRKQGYGCKKRKNGKIEESRRRENRGRDEGRNGRWWGGIGVEKSGKKGEYEEEI